MTFDPARGRRRPMRCRQRLRTRSRPRFDPRRGTRASTRQRLGIIEAIYQRSIAGSVTAARLYLRRKPQPLRR